MLYDALHDPKKLAASDTAFMIERLKSERTPFPDALIEQLPNFKLRATRQLHPCIRHEFLTHDTTTLAAVSCDLYH